MRSRHKPHLIDAYLMHTPAAPGTRSDAVQSSRALHFGMGYGWIRETG